MAADKLMINELIYFIQNALDRLTKEDIIKLCEETFDEDEIESSKLELWHNSHTTERFVKRTGKNKTVTNLSDIIDCINSVKWSELSVKFVSHNAAKVPYFEADTTDIRVIKKRLNELQNDNGNMNTLLVEFECMKNNIMEMKKMHLQQIDLLKSAVEKMSKQIDKSGHEMHDTKKASMSYSSAAAKMHDKLVTNSQKTGNSPTNNSFDSSLETNKWKTVERKKKPNIIGSNSNSMLKSIQVKKRFHLHATRFTTDTTVDSVKEYAENKGLKILECNKLESKFDTYNSFHIIVDADNTKNVDDLYSTDIWPMGILVRRYYLKRKV